jgi:hypothetical protein
MALFNECMQSCAHIVLDTADIVRDGDLSPSIETSLPARPKPSFNPAMLSSATDADESTCAA